MPPNTSQPLSQPAPVAGHGLPGARPSVPGWGPPPLSQRPAGPPGIAPLRGADPPGPRPADDVSQMQYFTGNPPATGPPRAGQAPPVGPPPMGQPGMPPPNLPPANPLPQTTMNMGYGAPVESRPSNYAGQSPMSDVSGPPSQFSAPPPPQVQPQMMGGYNYSSQPRAVPPSQAAGSTAGPPLSGPMSQPQPRKLDPDQMPSPVSLHG